MVDTMYQKYISLIIYATCVTFTFSIDLPTGNSACAKAIREADDDKTHFCTIFTSVGKDPKSWKTTPVTGTQHRILFVFNKKTGVDLTFGLRNSLSSRSSSSASSGDPTGMVQLTVGNWEDPEPTCSRRNMNQPGQPRKWECYGDDDASYGGSSSNLIYPYEAKRIALKRYDDDINYNNCVCYANTLCDYGFENWGCISHNANVAWPSCWKRKNPEDYDPIYWLAMMDWEDQHQFQLVVPDSMEISDEFRNLDDDVQDRALNMMRGYLSIVKNSSADLKKRLFERIYKRRHEIY